MELLALVVLIGIAYGLVKLDIALNFPIAKHGYSATYTYQDGKYRAGRYPN